jgi:hypothetical protein
MSAMNDTPETLRGRRRAGRKGATPASSPADAPAEPAVRALIEQALHPEATDADAVPEDDQASEDRVSADTAASGRHGRKRRRGRKGRNATEAVDALSPQTEDTPPEDRPQASTAATGDEPATAPPAERVPAEAEVLPDPQAEAPSSSPSIYDRWRVRGQAPGGDADGPWASPGGHGEPSSADGASDPSGGRPPPPGDGMHGVVAYAGGHRWVYLAVAVFLLAIGFGLWGVWTTFFGSEDADGRSAAALRARSEKLSQEVATLRRSDQISRDANRDLERTLAERDEEIAGLRADIAFYERFVGATGQRRGLSVHDLEMRLQSADAWHFVATLTQNVNRGAVNSGRITLALEGTRNDKLERLSWSTLRKQTNAPGLGYSFKYFQQVEGEVMLPAGFKPLRVTVRLVPEGGSAVEQSFPWPETVGDP